MILFGASETGLELRRQADGSTRLAGRFPYNRLAVLSDGGRNGRPRKEQFAPRAFGFRVDQPSEEIHLLVGHDFAKPLASRGAGTLRLTDSDEALTFEATISQAIAETSFGRDALALIAAGLAVGLSPGFRLPPERAVPRDQAERIEEEPMRPEAGMHGALIRTILQALLFELSIVTRPAYDAAQVEARCWTPGRPAVPSPLAAMRRWRR
jgi:HK97 family phage prohead protease